MKEPKVLVTQPLFAHDATKAKAFPFECLSLGYLVSSLRAAGIAADSLDAHLLATSNPDCVRAVERGGYSVVGISCSAQRTLGASAALARALKARVPDVHITVGGQFPSATHEQLLRSEPAFDSIVRGEGEETFPALIRQVTQGAGLEGVPGVTFRNGDGVVANPPAGRLFNLDAIPFPDRSYVGTILHEAQAGVRYVSMIGTRGCIYKCTFCSVDRPRATRSPANVVAELREIHETWGVWKFMFNDDLLVGSTPAMQAWAEELAELIKAEVPGLELWGMTRSDAVRPELFSKLRDAGFRTIFIGIESASDEVLKRFRKGTSARTNVRAIRTLKELGIKPEFGFIMLEPKMSWDDLRQNLEFLRWTGCFSRHNVTNRLNIYHGAPLYESAVQRGDIVPGDDLAERYPYEFEDPKVKLYSDLLGVLKRTTFEKKHDASETIMKTREVRADLCRDAGPETRHWPRVAELVESGRRLQRLEADRWLAFSEELYRRIDRGEGAPELEEGMPRFAEASLRDVVEQVQLLDAQADDVARAPVVAG